MQRSLNLIAGFIAFCCAMRLWQYFVGVRLMIYDLALLAFVVLFAGQALLRRRLLLPPSILRVPLAWLWSIAALSGFSFFALDFSLAHALPQFWKGLVSILFYTVGLTALACHLSSSPREDSERLLRLYVLGAVASSAYSFFEVIAAHRGFDLGKAIFGRLSVFPPSFDLHAPFYYEWDIFFRAVGFTGVNAQATYLASVIPLLLFARPFRRPSVNLALAAICLLGSALTFSRNGALALVVSLLVYLLLKPAEFKRLVPRAALVCLPVLAIALFFSEGARVMLSTRLYKSLDEVGAGRREIYETAWANIRAWPFGHGLNQFNVVALNSDRLDFTKIEIMYYMLSERQVREAYANLHDNWLNWLFEGGWPLLLAHLGYCGAVCYTCLRTRTDLGIAAVCALAGLLVSGLFNMTLDLFSTDLLFILLPLCAVRRAQTPGAALPRPPVAGQPGPASC